MRTLGWAIIYDDLTVFTSEDGEWPDAPGDGILEVVEFWRDAKDGQVRRQTYGAQDRYFMFVARDGAFVLASSNDPPEEIVMRYQVVGAVKRGKWTSRVRMREAMQLAQEVPCPSS